MSSVNAPAKHAPFLPVYVFYNYIWLLQIARNLVCGVEEQQDRKCNDINMN